MQVIPTCGSGGKKGSQHRKGANHLEDGKGIGKETHLAQRSQKPAGVTSRRWLYVNT